MTGSVALVADVPVDPDAGEARRLLLDELAKAQYQQSQPTWLDRLATGFLHWLQSLTFSGSGGPPWTVLVVVAIVVLVALGIAFLVFGVPRLNRRSAVAGSLFGEDEDRDAAAMRAAASAAAAAGDYSTAVVELFRAIARDLAERTVLSVTPGTTAREFAARAGRAFPESASPLAVAGGSFDAVRYLGSVGTREQYQQLVAVDATIRASRATLEPIAP